GQQRPRPQGGLPRRHRPPHRGARAAADCRTSRRTAMQAQDVMNRSVITLRPHMPVAAAAALLVARGVTSAPVVTAEGMLRGIVSEVDLLRARSTVSDGTAEHAATAADVMTPEPVTVRPTDELTDV